MANALVYCPSGGGKTVNSTRVAVGKLGRNLLLCSDNSSVVLRNFDRPNLDVINLKDIENFTTEFDKSINDEKHDNIIVDNLSDLFDMWILELDASGKFKDMRQAYQTVYQALKRLVRKAGQVNKNVIFTAWHDDREVTLSNGEKVARIAPKLQPKILDNICGLCNIVAYINTAEKDGKKQWYYILEGTPQLYAKDQLFCRKSCLPEDLFNGKGVKA